MTDLVESIVASLLKDPDFKPHHGRTKSDSAYAIANSQVQQRQRTLKALSLAKMFPAWTDELSNLKKAPARRDPYKRSHEKGQGFGVHDYPAQRKHRGTASASSGQPKGVPPFPGAQWNPITHQWHKPHMSGTGGEPSGTSAQGVAQYGQGQNHPRNNPTNIQNAEPAAGYGGGGAEPVQGGAPSNLTGGGFGGDDQGQFMQLTDMDDEQMEGVLKGCDEQVKYWEKQGYKDIANMYKAKMFEVEQELDRRAAQERGNVEKNFDWRKLIGDSEEKK